jgi:hypothetical protein
MIFLKVTRSVKNLGARFGWLIAEVVLVFLGMYGAFVLERMHDDDMDLLRKRQILQALVDEFANYEEELGSASNSLDEGYGIPFFTTYSSGDKPFPRPIPFGGMGSVNTGIWEAMLQSGGIEVLEVELIQGVQGFFKKLQDLLDLYSRFERLSESMILPEMDQSVDFFYEAEGSELRDKYKWYVNSLFTIGMSLRELSEQAKTTKELLLAEYSIVARDFIDQDEEQILPPQLKPTVVKEVDQESEQENQVSEVDQVQDAETSNLIQGLKESLIHIEQRITESSSLFDEQVAIPFFTSYSEGLKPALRKLEIKFLVDQEIDQIEKMIENLKSQSFSALQDEIITNLRDSLENCLKINSGFEDFISRTGIELTPSKPNHATLYYDLNSTELKEEFMWYPNELFKFGTAFRNLSEEIASIHQAINI